MTIWHGIFAAIFAIAALFLEIGVIILVGWLIGKTANRSSKSLPRASNSSAWINLKQSKKQPLAFSVAAVAGLIGTIGVALYFAGPFAGSEGIALIGLALAVIGAVAAGMIFGTSDRDYYL